MNNSFFTKLTLAFVAGLLLLTNIVPISRSKEFACPETDTTYTVTQRSRGLPVRFLSDATSSHGACTTNIPEPIGSTFLLSALLIDLCVAGGIFIGAKVVMEYTQSKLSRRKKGHGRGKAKLN